MKLLLKNASQIVTFRGNSAVRGNQTNCPLTLCNADVLITNGKIEQVGKIDQSQHDCTVIDCTGKTITAGLIDCHTHLIFAGDRSGEFALRLGGASYMEIMNKGGGIVNTVEATRKAGKEQLHSLAKKRLQSYLEQGVTTVEVKSGYGLDEKTEFECLEVAKQLNQCQEVEVVGTYMGAHATPQGFTPSQYVDFVCDKIIPKVAKGKMAQFVDAFCEQNVFTLSQCEKILKKAKECGIDTKLHCDEIVSLGGSAMACREGAVSIEHLLHITDDDIKVLAESQTVGVLLPLTAFSLKENFAPSKKMLNAGCAIAVATDLNPGSCFSNSIPMLFALCCISMGMSVNQTLCALTINAAAAIKQSDKLGTLDVGKQADLTIWDIPNVDYFAYNFGVNHAWAVIKKGKLVYTKQK